MACWNQAMLRIYVARYYLRVLCRISQYSNPEFAVAIYCGLKILATTLVSRFCSSTYLWICLRCKIAPTARFAAVFCVSLRHLLQNLGLTHRFLQIINEFTYSLHHLLFTPTVFNNLNYCTTYYYSISPFRNPFCMYGA